jgi:ribosomal protein S18 acetylase RimI-like enzyme
VAFVELADRARLERFLRGDAPAQIYALADLDDAFWPDTRWFASARADGELTAVCLVLEKLALPIVYAVAQPGDPATLALVAELRARLPERFFVNLPLGFAEVFAASHAIDPHGEYVKMWLPDGSALGGAAPPGIEPLGPEHAAELADFYRTRAYAADERQSRFFAPYMLTLGPWFGLRERGQLVCVAGVHVCSQRYGVAALGNVATVPERRGRGLARAVCARLCRALAPAVPLVGLNVAVANAPARACYRALGFREALRYEEAVLTRRADALC